MRKILLLILLIIFLFISCESERDKNKRLAEEKIQKLFDSIHKESQKIIKNEENRQKPEDSIKKVKEEKEQKKVLKAVAKVWNGLWMITGDYLPYIEIIIDISDNSITIPGNIGRFEGLFTKKEFKGNQHSKVLGMPNVNRLLYLKIYGNKIGGYIKSTQGEASTSENINGYKIKSHKK
jgi:hypothetical protein